MLVRRKMQNIVKKACVFASFMVASSALFSIAASAHTHKIERPTHVAVRSRHTVRQVATAYRHTTSFRHESLHLAAAAHGTVHHAVHGHVIVAERGHGVVHRERVTYRVRRGGHTYVHTVWRTTTGEARLTDGVYHHGYLECVPYARQVSGIDLTGNAANWWGEAAGRYARGQTPEPGAVLNFRANGRMRLGHVAVVQEVVNRREILITQANWGGPGFVRGGVSSDIAVVDVSRNNDWTAVRVALGHSSTYGSVYPTYGFIYRNGMPHLQMAAATPAPQIGLDNAPPADLRTAAERRDRRHIFTQSVQFAAAPSFGGTAINTSAPDRNLR